MLVLSLGNKAVQAAMVKYVGAHGCLSTRSEIRNKNLLEAVCHFSSRGYVWQVFTIILKCSKVGLEMELSSDQNFAVYVNIL